MKVFYTILCISFRTEVEARVFYRLMYKPKPVGQGISRRKLFVVRDRLGYWRVVRKINELELNDPSLDTPGRRALYRKYLVRQTAKCKRKIKNLEVL